MKRFKLVLLVAALALPASTTHWIGEAVAEDDMVSREEVQSMINEAVRKAFRQAVHAKQLIAMMKDRDERLEERFAERDESDRVAFFGPLRVRLFGVLYSPLD